VPQTKTRIMLNLADPSAAFRWWRLPADGVGLARMEFVVNSAVRCTRWRWCNFDTLKDEEAKAEIAATDPPL
jgi:pyruvate,water dikinase